MHCKDICFGNHAAKVEYFWHYNCSKFDRPFHWSVLELPFVSSWPSHEKHLCCCQPKSLMTAILLWLLKKSLMMLMWMPMTESSHLALLLQYGIQIKHKCFSQMLLINAKKNKPAFKCCCFFCPVFFERTISFWSGSNLSACCWCC